MSQNEYYESSKTTFLPEGFNDLATIEPDTLGVRKVSPEIRRAFERQLDEAGILGRPQSEESIKSGIDQAKWLVMQGEARESLRLMAFKPTESIDLSGQRVSVQFDVPIEFDPSSITSAHSFNSWLGRGKDGQGDVDHFNITTESVKKIEEYASRDTRLPPAELTLVINEDNTFEVVTSTSHRAAAAKLRSENIRCNELNIIDHRQNQLTEPEQSTDRYKTGDSEQQDWDMIAHRTEQLGISADPKTRAYDIADNFSTANDLKAMLYAVHQVLVPGYRTEETDFAMSVEGKAGKTTLVRPDERQAVLTEAVAHIKRLGEEMKRTGQYDAFLERAGVILGLAIVLAHPFADGNGRTARYVGDLVVNGPSSKSLQLAGSPRPEPGSPGIRLTSYVPRKEMSYHTVLTAAAGENVPLGEEEAYKKTASLGVSATPYWY